MLTRKKVLIDTDVDFDDYMAIVYLLQNPAVEVVAISVTGCGAAHLSFGVKNIANLLTLFGKAAESTPVLKGSQSPMRYSNVFPGSLRKDADIHYAAPFPYENPAPRIFEAQAWLSQYFLTTDDKVTVLSIGGGTTFGQLFCAAQSQPDLQAAIKRSIESIVMMGGNLLPEYVSPGAYGNIMPTLGDDPYYNNRVAEWNIFIDPLGAKYMFEFGIPLSLIALNATNDVPIDEGFVERLNAIQTPQAKFVSDVLAFPANAAGIGTFLSFWDPLAACTIACPELVTRKKFNILIHQELDEEQDRSGMLVVSDTEGVAIDVALSAAKEEVYNEYLRVLSLQ